MDGHGGNLTEPEKQQRPRFRLIFWLPMILVLYVLSVGPAAAIFGDNPPAPLDDVLRVIYAPVRALGRTPVGPAVDWWVNTWLKLRGDKV